MNSKKQSREIAAPCFDLCRLSRSKKIVDLCPNTLRKFNGEGLRFYRNGKIVFFSKSELEQFIRDHAETVATVQA